MDNPFDSGIPVFSDPSGLRVGLGFASATRVRHRELSVRRGTCEDWDSYCFSVGWSYGDCDHLSRGLIIHVAYILEYPLLLTVALSLSLECG